MSKASKSVLDRNPRKKIVHKKCKLLCNSFIFNQTLKSYAKEEALNKLNIAVLVLAKSDSL